MRSSCDATATKFALSWSSANNLLVEARPFDRERDALRHQLEQLDVGVRESPRHERADVQHADHLTVDAQRHAEHRLDALLAKDRIDHVGVVDVVENHRP